MSRLAQVVGLADKDQGMCSTADLLQLARVSTLECSGRPGRKRGRGDGDVRGIGPRFSILVRIALAESPKSVLPKPEFPPLLQPGVLRYSLSSLKLLTVEAFPDSARRAALWESLCDFVDELRLHDLVPASILIDGSFLTEKLNPDDIDLCVEIPVQLINGATGRTKSFLDRIKHKDLLGEPRNLDTFVNASADIGHPDRINYLAVRRHWEEDFGTALISGEEKGIVELEIVK
jgi:hypothetical protein